MTAAYFNVKLVTYLSVTIRIFPMTAYTTPELPRLIVNGSGKYKYVFTYKNHWVDGRSVRGKGDTQSVGKFVPDEDDKDKGEIF